MTTYSVLWRPALTGRWERVCRHLREDEARGTEQAFARAKIASDRFRVLPDAEAESLLSGAARAAEWRSCEDCTTPISCEEGAEDRCP